MNRKEIIDEVERIIREEQNLNVYDDTWRPKAARKIIEFLEDIEYDVNASYREHLLDVHGESCTCSCGLYVHPARKSDKAIHTNDCLWYGV